MNDVSTQEEPQGRGTRPRYANPWPQHRRALNLAESLLDMFTSTGERSMEITSRLNEIDVLTMDSIRMIEAGDGETAIRELRKIANKTTLGRHASSDVLSQTANAARRLAWALVGKYD